MGRAQKKSEREAELRNKFEAERREKAEKFQGVNLYLKVRATGTPLLQEEALYKKRRCTVA